MVPANRSQTRKVVAGLGIAAVLLVVTLLVFFAPNVKKMLQPSMRIIALMDDAGSLQKRSLVWMAGREVGTVEGIAFRGAHTDSTERIAVTMRIPRKYAPHIRRDSEARITSRRLIGQPVIDITPGSPGQPPLGDMDSLRIPPRATLEALMDKAATLNTAFSQLFVDMRAARVPAKRRAQQLALIETRLSASMTGMGDLFDALDRSPVRTLSDPAWQQLLKNLSANARELGKQLDAAVERAGAAHSDARPSLQRLALRVDTITAVVSEIEARVAQSGGGILLRAQRDSAIMKGVREARVQIDSLIAQTKRNPLRFWF